MAIINGARFTNKTKVKINVNSDVLEQIKQYCQWSGIEDVSYFFEEAAYFVFSKDKEWKIQKKGGKRAYNKRAKQSVE